MERGILDIVQPCFMDGPLLSFGHESATSVLLDDETTIHGVALTMMRTLQVHAVAWQSRASGDERQSKEIRHG